MSMYQVTGTIIFYGKTFLVFIFCQPGKKNILMKYLLTSCYDNYILYNQ